MSSPEDVMGDAVERLEFDERAEDETAARSCGRSRAGRR